MLFLTYFSMNASDKQVQMRIQIKPLSTFGLGLHSLDTLMPYCWEIGWLMILNFLG